MPIQVIADDSGYPGQGPHCVMAGLVGQAADWAAFSDQWAECLIQTPKIDYFKMREAAHLSDQFGRWSVVKRNRKLRDLAIVLNGFDFQLLYAGIDFAVFNAQAVENPTILGKPYFWAYHFFVGGACDEVVSRGATERFDLIFDDHPKFGLKTKLWYPAMLTLLPPSKRAIMPAEPMFRNDHDFMPLQAADLVAWLVRRLLSGEPNDFAWLNDYLPKIRLSQGSILLDAEQFAALDALSETIPMEFTPEMVEEFNRALATLPRRGGR